MFAQFGGRQLPALPDGLYEQTSLRELYIDDCPAAQQLAVSKLTNLTVLEVRAAVMSALWRAELVSSRPQQRMNGS